MQINPVKTDHSKINFLLIKTERVVESRVKGNTINKHLRRPALAGK